MTLDTPPWPISPPFRRSVFMKLLRERASNEGFRVRFRYSTEGVLVHYIRAATMEDWSIVLVPVEEMTDDKIKELLVRWRMGL